MTGLVSGLKRKTGEGIAYLHDQDRQGIQKFIGYVPWDLQPLLATLASQVSQERRAGWCSGRSYSEWRSLFRTDLGREPRLLPTHRRGSDR